MSFMINEMYGSQYIILKEINIVFISVKKSLTADHLINTPT